MPGLRGVMLDLARLQDEKREYFALLPRLREWGYDLLHLHLTDDEGCALVFPRRPEIASADAFTPVEMRELVREARRNGLEVVPEIEALGHARRITALRRYQELAEPVPKEGYNALCPRHPLTREVLSDLLADAADLFDSPLIHVGLDEVRFGDCPRCRRGGKEMSSEARFAEHAEWVLERVRALGRRPAMWGDHLLASRGLAKAVGRDVLIFDWHYGPRLDPSSLEFFTGAGYEVVEAPAASAWNSTRLAPTGVALANLRHAAAVSRRFAGRGLAGIVNTVWCPYRFLPGAADAAIAFAGHLFAAKEESPGFAQEFVEASYGLRRGKEAGAAVFALYSALLAPSDFDAVVWRGAAEGDGGREFRRMARESAERVRAAAGVLAPALRRARRNAERLRDLVVTSDVALAVARYAQGKCPALTAKLVREVERCWTRSRPAATFRTHGHGRGARRPDCLLCILARLGAKMTR